MAEDTTMPPVHPGEILLEEFLTPLGVSQYQLARAVDVPARRINEIVHGQRTGRLFAPIGITGYVPDLLQSISGIGNDFALDGGYCGKGHKEWVSVSSGGPHLLMKARLG